MKVILITGALLLYGSLSSAQEPATARPEETASRPPLSRGLLPEPGAIAGGVEWSAERFGIGNEGGGLPKQGFFVTSGKTIAGSGWIAAGAGYRHRLLGGRAFVEGSGSGSIRLYKALQAKFEWPRVRDRGLTLGLQARWQDLTQVAYFGSGPDSLDSMRSQYRVHYVDVIAYATAQANDILSIGATAGRVKEPHIGPATGPFRRAVPDTRLLFPDEPAFRPDAVGRFTHAGINVVADTRDHVGYPSRGGLYRAAWNSYWGAPGSILSFHRIETEGLQFVPLAGEWLSAAIHAWGLFTDTTEGRYVPFFMMGTIGGNSLRGYHAYRFSDKNLLLTSIETRVRLTTHIDGAAFADAGNVAEFARDLDFAKRSYGFGVRLHTRTVNLARLDVARGSEGWRVLFSVNDPFRLSRVTRRATPLPLHP